MVGLFFVCWSPKVVGNMIDNRAETNFLIDSEGPTRLVDWNSVLQGYDHYACMLILITAILNFFILPLQQLYEATKDNALLKCIFMRKIEC